ncbi:hypothetical protein [Actibacterium sp. 188UL27-1]|uniref:hypothetical protein n=1 Tax=Actibacterium sp. 188UL27-1 TaxID=2786961 RepID=UPI00195A5D42|nr:hypothetical protein [Actibacterium sp. 188UL27-1]MBM7069563.1 hypothetical protein [Actibacterium sp. 188UL27-1]
MTTAADASGDMPDQAGSAYLLPILACGVALLAFLALQIATYVVAGGYFEYPLDDPYIHMSIAEQIRNGGYGVNAGEYAAAASSILFPFLLLPFAGEELQRYLPLIWNIVGLAAAALLWGRILLQGGLSGTVWGMLLAIIGPLALNMVGVAFTGMEHSLHVAASLAIISGLLTFTAFGQVGWLLILGIALAPLLRFEGAALSLAAAGVVMLFGRSVAAFGLAALAVLPTAAFVGFLMSLGLEPLPSSVSAKLADVGEEAGGFLQFDNTLLTGYVQRGLLALVAIGMALLLHPRVRQSHVMWVLAAAILAALAHIALGKFGWMNRYEVYIFVTLAASVVAAVGATGTRTLLIAPVLTIVYVGVFYVSLAATVFPYTTRPVHLQQAQMARLAKQHLKQPVGVNDLGWVAWRNPDYVLDLWGLANHEARAARLSGAEPGWAADLLAERGIEFAMIYEPWLAREIGPDWQRLGLLQMRYTSPYIGWREVMFLVAPGTDTAPFADHVRDWAQELPPGSRFVFQPGMGG